MNGIRSSPCAVEQQTIASSLAGLLKPHLLSDHLLQYNAITTMPHAQPDKPE